MDTLTDEAYAAIREKADIGGIGNIKGAVLGGFILGLGEILIVAFFPQLSGYRDSFKVLADFGDAVLAGRSCKTGAKFVTWEWDFDRQGVHAGHYFMENYEAAKKDFAVRAGLVESQRLFSDEQIAVIKNACEFALEDDATLSYAEEKQLRSVQEQIEALLPRQEQEQRPTMKQTM